MKKTTRKKIPWIIMLLFLLVGLAFSVYLTILHVKVFTQAGYAADSSVCSISEKVNCETVAENPYSVFMGAPVSVWGIFGNLLMILGAALGIAYPKSKNVHLYMLGFTLFSIVISVALGYISITRISSICIFCFGTYVVNFTVFGLLLFVLSRAKTNPFTAIPGFIQWSLKHLYYSIPFVAIGLAGVIMLMALYPKYWEIKSVSSKDLMRLSQGIDKKGHHWIGARNPVLTIEEFSDYECPFCAKKHKFLRKMVSKYPEKIRLVHRNYPLDQACNSLVPRKFHPSACSKAKLAMCAGLQGKFWEANDLLFANRIKRFSPYMVSQSLGLSFGGMKECMASKDVESVLMKDVNFGIKRRFNYTPVLFANGKLFRRLSSIESMVKDYEGTDKAGDAWIGAKNPKVTIHEYSDYECPFCKKFHNDVRGIVSMYPDQVRLVHHHYPLDKACNSILTKPFHTKACLFSKYALCAQKQGRFWEANDYIFRNRKSSFSLAAMAKELLLDEKKLRDCAASPETDRELKAKVDEGVSKGLDSTPTFFIDGKPVEIKELHTVVKRHLNVE